MILTQYLCRVCAAGPRDARGHHISHLREGRVHAAISSRTDPTFFIVNREASPSFEGTKSQRDQRLQDLAIPFQEALAAPREGEGWWPDGGDWKPGTSPDLLAINQDGAELLVIEAKSSDAGHGITWGPVQSMFYGLLLDLWMTSVGVKECLTRLNKMRDQRVALGLTDAAASVISKRPRVRPVLAIGTTKQDSQILSLEYLRRMLMAPASLRRAAGLSPSAAKVASRLQIWLVDDAGQIQRKIH